MNSHRDLSTIFSELHREGIFLLPNVWNAGTARLLSSAGFSALATTSGGLAFDLGRVDGHDQVTREETLANARSIVAVTPLPVSVDLESGFGEHPENVAETIRLTARSGAVGGSIEDTTGDPSSPIRDFSEAVDRVTAAVEAARAEPIPFTLTARADNFFCGQLDLADTIRRLSAFEEAGADVLFAPGLPSLDAVKAVCSSVSKPVNVLAAGPLTGIPLREFAAVGVRRISLGSSLSRIALSVFITDSVERCTSCGNENSRDREFGAPYRRTQLRGTELLNDALVNPTVL